MEGAQFTLSWNDNSNNELGFCVERSSDGVHFKEIAITLANARSYVDNNVTAGATYHYRVRAFNLFGYSNFSNTSSAIIESAPSSPEPAPAPVEEPTTGTAPTSSLIGPSSKPGGYTLDSATGLHLITASGVGYESRDDALRFVHVQAGGDVRFVVRLRDYAPDAEWARAGVMIRQSLARDSRHASALITGGGLFEALYRTTDGGALSAKRTTKAGSNPYLAIEKVGSTITMSGSNDGKSWSVISKVQIGFGSSFLIGLSIGSEFDGKLSSGAFQIIETKSFSFAGANASEPDSGSDTDTGSNTGAAPTSSLIGPSSKPGEYALNSTTGLHFLSASGVGYESRDDALRFVNVPASGDVRFVARLRDYAPDADWSRTGLMIRQSLARDSRHASAVINGRGEFEALYRTGDGGALGARRTTKAGSDPYLAIEKVGSTITMSGSNDGKSWSVISKVQIGFGSSFLIGLSIGSEYDGDLSAALFEVISTESFSFAGSTSESDTSSDGSASVSLKSALIGPMSKSGQYSTDSSTGVHLVSASGVGYESRDDALRYAYVEAQGDRRFVIKLHDYNPDADWSRAGVMIRQSLARNSRHASALINGRGEFEALYRTKDGGALGAKRTTKAGATPYLAVEKTGSTLTMSGSKDGKTWNVISKAQISFGSTYLIGLSIGSEFDGRLSAAVMEVLQND